jgi:hypothetical protein
MPLILKICTSFVKEMLKLLASSEEWRTNRFRNKIRPAYIKKPVTETATGLQHL